MSERYYIYTTESNVSARETKRSGTVYDIRFNVVTALGERKTKKLSGFQTKKEAEKAHTEFITKYCTLIPTKTAVIHTEVLAVRLLVSDLVSTYITTVSPQLKPSSVYDISRTLNKYVVPYFKDVDITALTKPVLLRWQDDLWATVNPDTHAYYSYKYLMKIRGFFNTFLNWCAERYNVKNALAEIKPPRKRTPKTEMQIWTKEEFQTFINVVDNVVYKTFFAVLFYTGRRRGEVHALSDKDVHADKIKFNKTYSHKTVDGSKYVITSTKNEKKGDTIICAPLQEYLKIYKKNCSNTSPFFFGGKNPIPESTITNAFNKYLNVSGVKKIRVHDLRHSFVSRCIHLNASIYVVADLIGDTPEQILKTYGHLYEEDKKRIIQLLD